MEADEPQERLGTRKAIDSLANRLGWTHEGWMQDWPIEIADEIEIRPCLEAYGGFDEDERFVAMEGMLYALDLCSDKKKFNQFWTELSPILERDFHIHEYTIYYWTLFGEPNAEGIFSITPMCRNVWAKKK
jgi:hypothetical protein